MRRLVDEHLSGRRDHSLRLWLLVVFERWHRQYVARRPGTVRSLSDRCRLRERQSRDPHDWRHRRADTLAPHLPGRTVPTAGPAADCYRVQHVRARRHRTSDDRAGPASRSGAVDGSRRLLPRARSVVRSSRRGRRIDCGVSGRQLPQTERAHSSGRLREVVPAAPDPGRAHHGTSIEHLRAAGCSLWPGPGAHRQPPRDQSGQDAARAGDAARRVRLRPPDRRQLPRGGQASDARACSGRQDRDGAERTRPGGSLPPTPLPGVRGVWWSSRICVRKRATTC